MTSKFILFFLLALFFIPLHSEEDAPLVKDIPSHNSLFNSLKEKLEGKNGTYLTRSIKRIGDRTMEFEAHLSFDAEQSFVEPIMFNFSLYEQWALKRINLRPEGGEYYLKIYSLTPDPKDPNLINADFMIDLPAFKQRLTRRFRLRSEKKEGAYSVYLQSLPRDSTSVIESMGGFITVFPSPKSPHRLWLYVRSLIKLRSWFLYEALPNRILERESAERVQIITENYQDEEERLRKLKK